MHESSKKVLSIAFEVISLTILTIGGYVGMVMLFLRPPECFVGYTLYVLTGEGSSYSIPLVIVLMFDILWLATI